MRSHKAFTASPHIRLHGAKEINHLMAFSKCSPYLLCSNYTGDGGTKT